MAGPLEGIRVIEAAQVISGPLAGQLLAELGADVVKVENPQRPELFRYAGTGRGGFTAPFYNLNRGKRSVTLDLGQSEGRELLGRLVARADVFIQNYRPGAAQRMGAGPAEALAANPGLVYVSISGFGPDGPYAGRKAYDWVAQALVGMADHQRSPVDDQPDLVRSFVIDKATAYAAVQAISAALFARERNGGLGQHIQLSLLDVGLAFHWPDAMAADHTLLEQPERSRYDFREVMRSCRTADGGAITCIPFNGPFDAWCVALDRTEWLTDPRFAELEARILHKRELLDEVAEALAGLTTAEAMRRLTEVDLAVGEVHRHDEVHLDPQVVHNGAVFDHEVAGLGRVRQPRPPWRFGGTAETATTTVARLGEHNAEVLGELGLDADDLRRLVGHGVIAEPPPLGQFPR